MTRASKAGIVTVMWIMGLAMLVGFAWMVHWRDTTPVNVPTAADALRVSSVAPPLAALTSGAARSVGTAEHELRAGERSKAMHAIDAAMRVVEVGHENSHGEVKTAYTIGLKLIRSAREALHQGRAGGAQQMLARAETVLQKAIEPAHAVSPGLPPQMVWSGYRSAVLLNAHGAKIGRVQRIHGDGAPMAVLHLGGGNDVFGLFELGGREPRIPVSRLLWGPRRSLGSVFVALPVQQSQPTEILDAVRP